MSELKRERRNWPHDFDKALPDINQAADPKENPMEIRIYLGDFFFSFFLSGLD